MVHINTLTHVGRHLLDKVITRDETSQLNSLPVDLPGVMSDLSAIVGKLHCLSSAVSLDENQLVCRRSWRSFDMEVFADDL